SFHSAASTASPSTKSRVLQYSPGFALLDQHARQSFPEPFRCAPSISASGLWRRAAATRFPNERDSPATPDVYPGRGDTLLSPEESRCNCPSLEETRLRRCGQVQRVRSRHFRADIDRG